jgi:Na+-driven multidrug efflux pump
MRAQSDTKALTTLIVRCLASGLIAGLLTMLGLLLGEERVLAFYIGEGNDGSEATRKLLRTAWMLVATVQPLNGPVFVIDGILCGGQDFRYISQAYVTGFVFVFLPLIVSPLRMSLLGIWATKAAFNVYRCAAALLWVKADMKRLQEH